MNEPYVILVDNEDNAIGKTGKLEAHVKGLLHRAISVFIINSDGNWIIQKRALNKYHSNGLWTNTCCSHPYPGESNLIAAKRRLKEEMGLHCELKPLFHFTYIEKFENGLTENEFDHVYFGISDDTPHADSGEVSDWKMISFDDLQKDVNKYPDNYTVWFKKIFNRVQEYIGMEKLVND